MKRYVNKVLYVTKSNQLKIEMSNSWKNVDNERGVNQPLHLKTKNVLI